MRLRSLFFFDSRRLLHLPIVVEPKLGKASYVPSDAFLAQSPVLAQAIV